MTNEEWSVQVVGIIITGLNNPSSCEDRSSAQIEILKAEKDEIRVRYDDKEYSTTDPGYSNYGTDKVAVALNQVMQEVCTDPEAEFSDYLHNYVFRNGRAYDELSPGGGHYMCG